MMPGNPVKAICKNCGKEAAADQFKLHYKLKMMVCPNCFTGKTEKQAAEQQQKAVQPKKPPGWDADDEYLEKASRARQEQVVSSVTRIPGSSQVQYKCAHCKYSFKYNPDTKTPKTCPYCDKDVMGIRMF